MRLLILVLFIFQILSVWGDESEKITLKKNADFQYYFMLAIKRNPELKAAFYKWKAALQTIPQVRALPDPKLTYSNFLVSAETRVGPQEWTAGLSQMFPWFGVLKLRGEKATKQAEIAERKFEGIRLNLYNRLSQVYYRYWYLAKATKITKENLDILVAFERITRTNVRGGADLKDTNKVQIEMGKLENMLRSLQNVRKPLSAQIYSIINLENGEVLPFPKDFNIEILNLDSLNLLKDAAVNNPELNALVISEEKEKIGMELAKKDYYPSIGLGVNYIETNSALKKIKDSGKDPVIAMLTLSLPIWRSKYRAHVHESMNKMLAAEKSIQNKKNSLSANIEMALFEYEDGLREYKLFDKTLIPKAMQSLNEIKQKYTSGEATLLTLLDSQRLLLEFELRAASAKSKIMKELAAIYRLTGSDLNKYQKKVK